MLIIRQSAKLQWSKPVVLPKVIEFKQAMQHIGINSPEDRIDFVRKQGVPIFIASEPFLELEQYNVPVRLYAFAYDSNLSDANIFSMYIGQQRLCLDAADYEYLLKKYGQKLFLPMQRVFAIWKRPSPIYRAHSRYSRQK